MGKTTPPSTHGTPPWRGRLRVAVGSLLGVLALAPLSTSVAHAEPTAADKAAAEVLFEEGRKLVLAGEYKKAAEKFEASQRLDAGVGTLLYLADAYEKSGRTASAWATFREAAASAKASGYIEREVLARDRAAALEPQLSYLTLSLTAAADRAGLKVTRNGAEVTLDVLGVPVPTDPGAYVVRASAPGKKPFSASVAVTRAPSTATLTIPALEDLPTPKRGGAAAAPNRAAAPDDVPRTGKVMRTLGVVGGSVGLIGLGVGGALIARAIDKDAEADDHCDGARCRDPVGVELSEEARSAADFATVALGAGGALAAGGIVLLLTAPSRRPAAARATLSAAPVVCPNGVGFAIGGRF